MPPIGNHYVLVATLPLVNHKGGDLSRDEAWQAFRQKVMGMKDAPTPEKLFQVVKIVMEPGPEANGGR
jgi:hypothetical protein